MSKRLTENGSKILRWLRGNLFTGKAISRIVMNHLNVNDKLSEIHTISVSDNPEEVDETLLYTWTEIFDSAATTDADGLGGMQKYMLQIFSESEERPIARLPIRYVGDDVASGGEDLDSEPANAKGLVRQAQRHAEGFARISLGATTQLVSTLQRINARQADMIEKLVAEKLDTLQMVEQLHSEKHSRDLETEEAQLKNKIKKEAFDRLAMLAPVLVNKIAGRKILPEKMTPVESMLKDLAESITDDQMQSLRSVLKPEQLIAISEFMLATQGEDTKGLTDDKTDDETKQLSSIK